MDNVPTTGDSVWFGTLIRELQLNINTNNLLRFVYNEQKKLPHSNLGTVANGWQSPNLKDDVVFKPLTNEIFKNLNGLSDLFLIRKDKKLVISAMWANINPSGGSNIPHTHPNSILSGVFYLKCNDKSGNICFTHPAMNHNYHFDTFSVSNYNNINAGSRQIKPNVGKMLIFPSYQYHYVQTNLSNEDRVTLAFNTCLI